MASLVDTAIRNASAAMLDADLEKAESVITNDAELDELHEELEYKCLTLLALQAPVASELRTIVSTVRVIFELARMGDLAAHIAKIARMRYPDPAIPEDLRDNFTEMAQIAEKMVGDVEAILRDRDVSVAEGMATTDAEMDELRRVHFGVILAEDWQGSTQQAIDVALAGRYLERIADHAVAVARRVIYIVTGDTPEGEDWPNA